MLDRLPQVEQHINHVLSDGKGNMYECVHSEFNHTISKGLQVHWDTMFFFVQVAHACRCADIPVPNEVVSSQKKRRSVGTKKEPTCSVCHSRKHYGSSCPHLAQKLLKAVRKTTGLKNLVNAVSERRLLTVLEAKKKPRRTLTSTAWQLCGLQKGKTDWNEDSENEKERQV